MGARLRLFVAHSSHDRPDVVAFGAFVATTRLPFDVSPLIPHSLVWWTHAREAIAVADLVIVCPSDSFLASRGCLAELNFALRLGRPIARLLPEPRHQRLLAARLSSTPVLRLDWTLEPTLAGCLQNLAHERQ